MKNYYLILATTIAGGAVGGSIAGILGCVAGALVGFAAAAYVTRNER